MNAYHWRSRRDRSWHAGISLSQLGERVVTFVVELVLGRCGAAGGRGGGGGSDTDDVAATAAGSTRTTGRASHGGSADRRNHDILLDVVADHIAAAMGVRCAADIDATDGAAEFDGIGLGRGLGCGLRIGVVEASGRRVRAHDTRGTLAARWCIGACAAAAAASVVGGAVTNAVLAIDGGLDVAQPTEFALLGACKEDEGLLGRIETEFVYCIMRGIQSIDRSNGTSE